MTRVEEEKKLHTADKFIGLREAADLADVHQRTIRNWDKAGKLASTKQTPSGRPRYKYDEVLKLKKKHT